MRDNYQLDLSQHRSKLLTTKDIENAYIIVPVKTSLAQVVAQAYPDSISKIRLLANDIPDPWHQPVSVFRACANQIDLMLEHLIKALLCNKE